MTVKTFDSIISKCANHEEFTADERKELDNWITYMFGVEDSANEFTIDDGILCCDLTYPETLLCGIYGHEYWMTDKESIKEICNNFDYVLDKFLTSDESAAIRLYYKNKMSLEEISKIFNVSRETVRQRIARAIRKLRHPSRLDMIWAPHKLSEDIKAKKAILEQKNQELNTEITKAMACMNKLVDALGEAGVKIETNVVEQATLSRDIDEFSLSIRARNCLKRKGLNNIGDICALTEDELYETRNLGRKCFEEVRNLLLSLGVWFKTEDDKKVNTEKPAVQNTSLCETCTHYDKYEHCCEYFGYADAIKKISEDCSQYSSDEED